MIVFKSFTLLSTHIYSSEAGIAFCQWISQTASSYLDYHQHCSSSEGLVKAILCFCPKVHFI